MKIEKLDYYGRGITYIDGKICFVIDALDQEEVTLNIELEKKRYLEATVKSYLKLSNDRIQAKCKYYHECGGCQIMHMNTLKQKKFKEEKVKNIINHNLNSSVSIYPIEESESFFYRNKVVFHVVNHQLGFYQEKTHKLINVCFCYLLNSKINELIPYLNEWLKDEDMVKKITIKVGNETNEVMISIEGKVKHIDKLKRKVDVLYINHKVYTKKDYILSKIGTKTYQIRENSFFQVNQYITKKLYDEVLKNVKNCHAKKVLDLYCGTGTIGLYIASEVEKVVGIEVVSDAIIDANKNKSLNNISNIKFILGDVEKRIEQINEYYDMVIVDPPRSGMSSTIISTINKLKPEYMIYVSCDTMTLARDLKQLEKEYNIDYIKPFDMFPNTYHVECVCLLKRKNYQN